MFSNTTLGWGAILVGVLIALTEYVSSWNSSLNYLWAVIVLIWGIIALVQ